MASWRARVLRRGQRIIDASTQRIAPALDRFRRGDRIVLQTPAAGLRLGNLLYLWLNAHQRSREGEPVSVLACAGMEPWWVEFPALRDLSLKRDEQRFADRREWDGAWQYQRFGEDYSRDQLHAFIQDTIAERAALAPRIPLVINVRRGDFYGTEFEAKHGFPIVPYLAEALTHVPHGGRATVVSDDPAWCERELSGLLAGRYDALDYAPADPLANLLTLAGARVIVGANSTFSYWGAYIADAVHGDAQVIMPRFHARMAHGTDAFQLDPRWVALDGFS